MPHLYMPADHSDADVALAGRVAEAVDSAELFVAWTRTAGAACAPEAPPREEPVPVNPFAHALAEIVIAFSALFSLLLRPGRSDPDSAPPRAPRLDRSPMEGADR